MCPPRARADLIPPDINRKWAWHYHALLQLKERFQTGKLGQAAELAQALPDRDVDPADRGSDLSAVDVAFSLLAQEQAALAEIEAALQRLHRGTYGKCEASGKRISPARLRAIPWCRRTTAAERAHQNAASVRSKPMPRAAGRLPALLSAR